MTITPITNDRDALKTALETVVDVAKLTAVDMDAVAETLWALIEDHARAMVREEMTPTPPPRPQPTMAPLYPGKRAITAAEIRGRVDGTTLAAAQAEASELRQENMALKTEALEALEAKALLEMIAAGQSLDALAIPTGAMGRAVYELALRVESLKEAMDDSLNEIQRVCGYHSSAWEYRDQVVRDVKRLKEERDMAWQHAEEERPTADDVRKAFYECLGACEEVEAVYGDEDPTLANLVAAYRYLDSLYMVAASERKAAKARAYELEDGKHALADQRDSAEKLARAAHDERNKALKRRDEAEAKLAKVEAERDRLAAYAEALTRGGEVAA